MRRPGFSSTLRVMGGTSQASTEIGESSGIGTLQDARLEPYRKRRPVVNFIAEAPDWMLRNMNSPGQKGQFVGLNFNSSQSGVLDVKSGEFFVMGQD